MSRKGALAPIADAFRGGQLKPTLILLVSPVLLITWKYFGAPEYYSARIADHMTAAIDPIAAAAVYSFGMAFLLMGILPALMVKFVFREKLTDYGVGLGKTKSTILAIVISVPVFVVVGFLSSSNPSIIEEYPVNRNAGSSAAMFMLHGFTYALFYLGWEFHFRGFLQFGLKDSLGAGNALLVQVLASVLVHIGKPCIETYAAILGGIVWGLIAYRTRSLSVGLAQHFALGLSLDWFICNQ